MKNLKILVLFIILSSNSTLLSGQSSKEDSTRLYSLPIWQMWQFIQIAKEAETCSVLVTQQENHIQAGLIYEASQDSLLQHRSIQIVTLTNESSNWENRFNNAVALTTIEKKRKRKWKWIAIPAIGILTYKTAIDVRDALRNTP